MDQEHLKMQSVMFSQQALISKLQGDIKRNHDHIKVWLSQLAFHFGADCALYEIDCEQCGITTFGDLSSCEICGTDYCLTCGKDNIKKCKLCQMTFCKRDLCKHLKDN